MPPPNQLSKLNFSELPVDFNAHYSNLIDRVNDLMGWNGPISVADHIDLGGKRVINIGPPVAATDALPSGVAARTYSAAALRPQLESNGSSPLKTQRRLNDPNQREQQSSWLNDLMSSVPSAW